MNKLLARFNAPFPDRASAKKTTISLLGIGLFVSLFLYLLRPFGMANFANEQLLLLICAGFGAVTIVCGLLFEFASRYVFRVRTDVPSWTLAKWMLHSAMLIALIALGNFLYINAIMSWEGFTPLLLLQMLGNTLLVGIFPLTFSGLMMQLRAARNNQQSADALKPELAAHTAMDDATVVLTASGSQELKVHTKSLRYAEAMQNYVAVYYEENGALTREILRSTIGNMEVELANSPMVRCHRSYLVNIDAIEKVAGNAQGLKLSLADVSEQIVPVSRSYIPTLRALLDQQQKT